MDNKDRNKFFEFFAAEGKNLKRYVTGKLHSISEADAEDIIGDLILKLLTRTESTNLVDNPAGYIYRALHNKIIDYKRAQNRTVSLESCLDEDGELCLMSLISGGTPGPETETERRDFMHRFGQAVSRLEPKQRAVFIATEMDGQSFKSLSERWHEPVGTLLSRKYRAVKALREMLKDEII